MGFGSRFSSLRDLVLGMDFLLIVMRVNNWNYDLFLWQTPAVFETEDFRGGATKILSEVLKLLK